MCTQNCIDSLDEKPGGIRGLHNEFDIQALLLVFMVFKEILELLKLFFPRFHPWWPPKGDAVICILHVNYVLQSFMQLL